MKIVQINATAGSGSTGKIAVDISNVLDTYNIKNYIIFNSYKCFKNNTFRLQSDKNRIFNALLSRISGRYGFVSYFITKKLLKKLDEINPDIIHLHNIHSHDCNLRMLFKYIKNNNKQIIWTFHDCWAFTGYCTYFDLDKCYKWKDCCNNCPQYKQFSWFFDRSKKNFLEKKKIMLGINNMTIVCPSNWLANLVKQSFLKNYPVQVINNGINMENFKQIDNHTFDNIIDRNKKILLGVASPFGERKGYSDFIKLSKIIDKTKYQIVMIGVNVKQIKELQEYEIIGIERTENQIQLAELYSLAYCFLNTTYEDNFPTVNIEALACGCPVITYKTGGSIEVITNEKGYIVEQGNIDELYRTINNLKNSNIDRENISNGSKALYDKQIMCKKYLEIYEEFKNDT